VNHVGIKFDLHQRIKETQQKDDKIIKTLKKLQREKIQGFIIDKEVLSLKHQVCVPQYAELKKETMTEAHCTPYTAHPGSTEMY